MGVAVVLSAAVGRGVSMTMCLYIPGTKLMYHVIIVLYIIMNHVVHNRDHPGILQNTLI